MSVDDPHEAERELREEPRTVGDARSTPSPEQGPDEIYADVAALRDEIRDRRRDDE